MAGEKRQGAPDGHDATRLNMTIGHYKGNVIIDFGEQITFMSLPPDEAQRFADMILEHAEKAVRERLT